MHSSIGRDRAIIINAFSIGRDSALAMRKRNDLESTQRFLSENERDSELIRRITEQMATSKDDLQALKKSFQIKDRNKTGKLTMEEVYDNTI